METWTRTQIDSMSTWLEDLKKNPRFELEEKKEDELKPVSDGSRGQQLVYKIVENHVARTAIDPKGTAPLRLVVDGTGGSGKTWVIKHLQNLLGERCIAAAPTCAAAFLIEAESVHSVFHIPVTETKFNKTLKLKQLEPLRERFANIDYIIIDEKSLCGANLLYWVHQRLTEIKNTRRGTSFGGLNIILLGHNAQLDPVRQVPIYRESEIESLYDDDASKAQIGRQLYTEFTDAVVLTANNRIDKEDPQAEVFKQCLLNIQDGKIKNEDYELLKTRFRDHPKMTKAEIARFDDAPRLFYRNWDVNEYNGKKLFETDENQPICELYCKQSHPGDRKLTESQAGNVPSYLPLRKGCRIMLRKKLWQKAGLFNGTTGTVFDIVYHPDRPYDPKPGPGQTPNLPLAVIVQFDAKYNQLPTFDESKGKRLIPIPIAQHAYQVGVGSYHTRTGVPMILAWARTVHKTQGQTLTQAVIDLGDKEVSGFTYTAISRITKLSGVIFEPFTRKRLDKSWKDGGFKTRRCHDHRLHYYHRITRQSYAAEHNSIKCIPFYKDVEQPIPPGPPATRLKLKYSNLYHDTTPEAARQAKASRPRPRRRLPRQQHWYPHSKRK